MSVTSNTPHAGGSAHPPKLSRFHSGGQYGSDSDEHEPFARLRGRLERMRASLDGSATGSRSDEDLALEVMLLREENARLKVAQHRPSEVGTMIDHLRAMVAEFSEPDVGDELWRLMTDVLVVREEVEQACLEIEVAARAARERLQRLAPALDGADVAPHALAVAGDEGS